MTDSYALFCPDCKAKVRTRKPGDTGPLSVPAASPPASGSSGSSGAPEPVAFIVGGLVTAAAGGLIQAGSGGEGAGAVVAALLLFLASTLWLVGVIALGVRVGLDGR
ncbi:hypothetical protein ASD81_00435 [Nocardioides sp. Root614]|nr:hypothetical protein ASD81_00435 [Nocardioides sp. Root614]